MDSNRYSNTRHCPKCDQLAIRDRYVAKKEAYEGSPWWFLLIPLIGWILLMNSRATPEIPEHMHRTCLHCGYEWDESLGDE